ncbi:MAG: hypothetical protein ACOYXT_02855, partial [Bacteroidota bacterium]
VYALMSRCLFQEASSQDQAKLKELLDADMVLREQFEQLKQIHARDQQGPSDKQIDHKFNSLTRRLKDEGLL